MQYYLHSTVADIYLYLKPQYTVDGRASDMGRLQGEKRWVVSLVCAKR